MHFSALTFARAMLWRSVSALALACLCSASLYGQGKSQAAETAKPFAAYSASAQVLRDSLVRLARAQVGTRYVPGGQSPDRGFDCSGLVKYVMSALHVSLPRTARQQATVGELLARDTVRLRPGDLLTFARGERSGVNHVGIYIGNGKYVHASSGAGRVIESAISRKSSSLVRGWRGARRVLQVGAADSAVMAKPVN